MFDVHQVQFQHQSDQYVQRLANQFGNIRSLIEEKGETVTLHLKGGGRALTQVINRDHVTASVEPVHPAPGQEFGDLSYNESYFALESNNFRFDVDEIDSKVSSRHLETLFTTNAAAAEAGALDSEGAATATVTRDMPVAKVMYSVILKEWTVLEDCSYTTDNGVELTAKVGFRYDLASVPRYLWWLIAPFDFGTEPPLFHDLLYRAGGTVTLPSGEVLPAQTVFTRKEADDIFLEVMTRSKVVGYWRRMAGYYAVRGFGRLSWRGKPDD